MSGSNSREMGQTLRFVSKIKDHSHAKAEIVLMVVYPVWESGQVVIRLQGTQVEAAG
jgi:hypothetical protein